MQRMAQKLIAEKLQRPNSNISADQRRFGGLMRHNSMNNKENVPTSHSHRSRIVRTYSVKSHQTAARPQPGRQFRAHMAAGAGEVLIKRALAPPKRRVPLRWWNFRPTPSRLSNMSNA